MNKIDFKKLKPIAKMQDPARYPKIQLRLEGEMKQSYKLQMQKMLIDVTKIMVDFKTK